MAKPCPRSRGRKKVYTGKNGGRYYRSKSGAKVYLGKKKMAPCRKR